MGWAVLSRLALRIYLRHWRRMLFFSTCIAAGVGFLVGVESLRSSIEAAVAESARELLAGDVELSSQRPLDEKARAALARLEREGHRVAQLLYFSSMLSSSGEDPFLVAVKAAGPGYPFYGRLVTHPEGARAAGLDCLLDETAAAERGLKPGSTLKLGNARLRLAGLILKEPDRTMSGFNLAPRLMISLEAAEATGLLGFGARLRQARLLALPPGIPGPEGAQALKARLERELADPYLSLSAYIDADPAVSETLQRVGTFFLFLSLVALMLGAVGMASSVTMFLADQMETAATLRCLGFSPHDVGRVYGLLCLAIGAIGGLLGALGGGLLGVVFLAQAASWLGLVVPVAPRLDGIVLAEGFILACALAAALNASKVAALSRVAPMDVLRGSSAGLTGSNRSKAALALGSFALIFVYAFLKSNSWQSARSFTLALTGTTAATTLLILGALQLLAWAPLSGFGFTVRHGLLALTRQRGRTLVFLFTLALGLTLIGALGIVHRSLRSEILLGRSARAPDHFLIDIQKSQLQGVREVLRRYAGAQADPAPLVRARLTHVNGQTVGRRDTAAMTLEDRARQRFMTREYNLTYKDTLQDSEVLVEGRLWAPGETRPQISLEQSFAKRIGVGLGARLTFDVQGRPVEGVVTSVRKIEWISMRPNFFVVFPTRVLEPAPQTFITSMKLDDARQAAAMRRELIRAYPNVSVIDLSKVLDNVQNVLGALIKALNLLAWFCLSVGLLVLAGTLGLGRKQRLEQASLYRALGCTSGDLARMDSVEFLAIGSVAFVIAAATSHLLGWAIARQMGVGFAADPWALLSMALAGLLLPLGVGLFVYRPAYKTEALAALREPS